MAARETIAGIAPPAPRCDLPTAPDGSCPGGAEAFDPVDDKAVREGVAAADKR